MSDAKFGSWSVAESSVAIEYSLVVIEEIRQAVAEGFQRFARGGIEVGGVLYGTCDGKTARILAMREIACEHALGPSFLLSGKDRAALTEQIDRDRRDPRLEGFTVLGWFLSHTRSEIVLLPADQETYEAFFPELWHVTLVVRPGRGGAMRAGFFVRESDGTVRTERTYLDFDIPAGIPGVPDRSFRERSGANDRRETTGIEALAAAIDAPGAAPGAAYEQNQPPAPAPPFANAPEYTPHPRRRGLWTWLIVALVVAGVAVAAIAGLRYFGPSPNAEPIALAVFERDAQLRIEWNRNSESIRRATKGTLEILDGADSKSVPLSAADLTQGSFTYARRSGDVQVRIEIQNARGKKMQEESRFLGTPPRAADANELDAVQLERDALQDEVTHLRVQTVQQANRIRQLERTLTILRARLGGASSDTEKQ